MKTLSGLALTLLLIGTPVSVAAQTDSPPPQELVDLALVERLCAAAITEATELEACLGAVEAALEDMAAAPPVEGQSLLEQAQTLVDDTLADLRAIDFDKALDDLAAQARDFELDVDLQGAIDDAVATVEGFELDVDVDLQAALDQAVADALAATEDFDLQAAVDAALADAQAAIEEADLQGVVDEAVASLEQGVAEAQAVVAEAQRWAQENHEAVCRGGSISLGTTVGVAVFVLTGVEWLGLQAFWATERLTNGICGDLAA